MKLLVIGNGMVGHHCIEQLVERGALNHYQVHVFSEEPMRAYDRVHLSEYFSGRDAESLARRFGSVVVLLHAVAVETDRGAVFAVRQCRDGRAHRRCGRATR